MIRLKINEQLKFWINKVALLSALGGAIYYFVVVLYITLSRIHYPFSLEWDEGASLIQVQRILTGRLLYDQPSYQYIALIYPPIFYYTSAIFVRVFGLGFFPLRLVSFMSSIGSTVVIYLVCRREKVNIPTAIMASGLFVATYRLSGAWFDIARVDMLALFFLLLSIYLLGFRSAIAYIMAGIAIALACLTKQTHIISFIFISLYLLLFERKSSFLFIIFSVLSFSIFTWQLDRVFSSWYTFFVFKISIGNSGNVALTSSAIFESINNFWADKTILPLIIAIPIIVVHMIMQLKDNKNPKSVAFYLFCSMGMIGTSWASIVHIGGYDNGLIPAYAILAILFGLGVDKLCFNQAADPILRSFLLFACAIQFMMLRFPIAAQIPTTQDLLAGNALVREIQKQSGDVYIPFHPELDLIAGKPAYASWDAMYQLEGGYGGGDLKETQRVKAEFLHAMANHHFFMIILDKDLNWVWGYPDKYYTVNPKPVFQDQNVFWPVTGWQVRPTIKMLPIQP